MHTPCRQLPIICTQDLAAEVIPVSCPQPAAVLVWPAAILLVVAALLLTIAAGLGA